MNKTQSDFSDFYLGLKVGQKIQVIDLPQATNAWPNFWTKSGEIGISDYSPLPVRYEADPLLSDGRQNGYLVTIAIKAR
jgi:hypothetical protein